MKSELKSDNIDWSFKAARCFLRTNLKDDTIELTKRFSQSDHSSFFDPGSSNPVSLGDFSRLLRYLGSPALEPVDGKDVLEREVIVSFDSDLDVFSNKSEACSSPASSHSDQSPTTQEKVDGATTIKNIRWNCQDTTAPDSNPIFEPTLHYAYLVTQSNTHTSRAQKTKLMKRLCEIFPGEIGIRTDTNSLVHLGTEPNYHGIHIFVDLSNINIGFMEKIKAKRNIKTTSILKNAPMSFQSLALVMERGRKVARRVLVGSTSSMNNKTRTPFHIEEAKLCHYEINILERVYKPTKSPSVATIKKQYGIGSGFAKPGNSSGSESSRPIALAMAEQGVDEVLHMKILETLVDYEVPSTIVLASGDAAEAEYSGGFFTNVERALKKGWNVEIVSWKDQLSREYCNEGFLARWGKNFRIITLDDFVGQMLAMYALKNQLSTR